MIRMKGEGVPWQLCYWVAVGIEKVLAKKKKSFWETPVMILRGKALEEPSKASDGVSFITSVEYVRMISVYMKLKDHFDLTVVMEVTTAVNSHRESVCHDFRC